MNVSKVKIFRKLNFEIRKFLGMSYLNNDKRRKVISIIGTTGVGKSQLSIELSKKINGEIINADSMQMYKNLDNITNKHPINERRGIKHHVMNHIDWNENYYIHKFRRECEEAMNEIWDKGKIPILVGGTHYYLQSVLFDNKTIDSNENNSKVEDISNENLTKLSDQQLEILNNEDSNIIFEKLKEVDPIIANKFHPNDKRRIRRALEIYYLSGEKASSVYETQRKKMENTGTSLKYDTLFFWIYSKNEELDKRLDSRVDKMMFNGGLRELSDLYKFYLEKKLEGCEEVIKMDNGVWQVIGFKEFLPYLEKEGVSKLDFIENIENENERIQQIEELYKNEIFKECCDEMKVRTRRYARKQVKWIKNSLGPELKEEEDNGFVKFGKIYVLDATDLSKWNHNVSEIGGNIIENFLKLGYVSDDFEQIPESLKNEKQLIQDNKKSTESKMANWVHHTCDICTNKETGEPLVYVGDQWEIHLKSKKHKFNLNRGKRKREYEEWLAKNESPSNKK